MKKFLCTIISLFIFNGIAYSKTIEGGVSFDVNSAREYLEDGQSDGITNILDFPDSYYQFHADNTEKVVYSYNNSGDVVGITVQYINEPTRAYIYSKSGRLIYVEKYDRPINIYPHRGYRYNLDGQLDLSSLTVSKKEMFRFSPDGKLIVHSLNGVIYDEQGNVIGKAK